MSDKKDKGDSKSDNNEDADSEDNSDSDENDNENPFIEYFQNQGFFR